jgi:hypothetical protein
MVKSPCVQPRADAHGLVNVNFFVIGRHMPGGKDCMEGKRRDNAPAMDFNASPKGPHKAVTAAFATIGDANRVPPLQGFC